MGTFLRCCRRRRRRQCICLATDATQLSTASLLTIAASATTAAAAAAATAAGIVNNSCSGALESHLLWQISSLYFCLPWQPILLVHFANGSRLHFTSNILIGS